MNAFRVLLFLDNCSKITYKPLHINIFVNESCFCMKIHADLIRFYFFLIKRKSLSWYFVKDEYITDDWLKGKKSKMCSLIYVLCAFKGLLKKIGQVLLSARFRGVSSWLFSNLNQLLVLCMSQCCIRVCEVEMNRCNNKRLPVRFHKYWFQTFWLIWLEYSSKNLEAHSKHTLPSRVCCLWIFRHFERYTMPCWWCHRRKHPCVLPRKVAYLVWIPGNW